MGLNNSLQQAALRQSPGCDLLHLKSRPGARSNTKPGCGAEDGWGKGCWEQIHAQVLFCREQSRGWGGDECRWELCRAHTAPKHCWLHQPSNCLCKQPSWLVKVPLWSAINCSWQIERETAWDRYLRSESKTHRELNLCFNSSTLLPPPAFPGHICCTLFGAYLGAHLDGFAFPAVPGGTHVLVDIPATHCNSHTFLLAFLRVP